MANPAKINPEIEIGLTALCLHAQPDVTLTRQEIADVCNCSDQAIREIEIRALKKATVRARRMGLHEFLED
ncbi:hypothetical protein [Alteromonas confluentis]|uniref:RNA polymerase sigma-70 region 4 domain-containing protein n=1 Tax=Alteromonas confluentis TaxID=1656094 RepID=A0A1E7ZEB4_9ALTE|nr:hypothetical protein [Alteromonas confluentis]OFC71792.1 hypothetical protein BFC18_06460 [Alteromonas confluentis]